MRSLVASIAALALAIPAAAAAQPVSTMGGAGPDTYLELHLGAFVPEGDLDALDPNVDFGLTFGARFNPNLSAEVGIGYARASANVSGGDRVFDEVPILANLRVRYPMKGAELSAFAGGGVHFAHVSASTDVLGLSVYSSSRDTTFGWQVGAEAAFNFSPTMRAGFEVMRTFATASFGDASTDIGGLRLAGTLGYHF